MKKRTEEETLEILSMDMEDHIARYTPIGWTCDIRNVCHRHYVMPADAKNFLAFFKEGELEKKLGEYRNGEFNEKHFEHWYVQEAIVDYYKKGKHEKIINDDSVRLFRPHSHQEY
jgi:hypothetical protein